MLTFGLLSYGLAAAAFLLLTLLLLTSWEGRSQGARLVVACAVTTGWAAMLALGSGVLQLSVPVLLLVEALRYGAWLFVLTGLTASAGIAGGLSRTVTGVWIAIALGPFLMPFVLRAGLPGPSPSQILVYGGLAMALLGLMLLEQVYRNASESGRHALKFFVIALGVMYAYDLFVFSQALLVRGVEAVSWQTRGLVYALLVPLVAIAARRNPQWSLNVFVSRQVVFYTTSVLAIGLYLLLMAFGGYLIRMFGGQWGAVAQLVFLAGSLIVLASLMASGSVRRRLRVFLSKHFYRNKYDYRVEWLRFIDTLSAPAEGGDPRANCVRSIAQIIGSPRGVLYLRGEEAGGAEYVPVAAWPDGPAEFARCPPVPAANEMVAFIAQQGWVVDVDEYRRGPHAYHNVVLPEFLLAPGAGWRFVLPLMLGSELSGLVLLAPPPPPFNPTYEDRDLLKTVGRHVATHLAQHEADRQLADSRQFEAYHRLTAFVMHDLKNLAAQLSLIVANADKHKRNPEFVDDAIETIANSTGRMQRLIEQLQRREIHTVKRRVSLGEIARRAVERCRVRAPLPEFTGDGGNAVVEADQERLTMIVEHVIRNAQEATSENGRVTVGVGRDGEWETVTVTDDGAGMSSEFLRDRLFKPFDTTKGSKGMGIGAYQVREYVQSLGGRVTVESREGEGTRFVLQLPSGETANPATEADSHA